MKIAGIIAEYNPFHLGHAYHVQKTKALTGCDYVVACMAGSYTQRGEAACLSKWERTRMALCCGVDAVFDLPALFAVRTADAFARGGVGILAGLGVDVLSFGCEDEQLPAALAALRQNEPAQMTQTIRRNLEAGMSHVRAWGAAAAQYLGVAPDLLNAPNVILAAEYLRAIHLAGSTLQTLCVRRQGSYHDLSLDVPYASASAIREGMRLGNRETALAMIPERARPILAASRGMHPPDDLLLACLRTMSEEQLRSLPEMAEGLERRLLRSAAAASGREDLLDRLKCKRYTRARLSRLLAHALLGLTQDLAARHPQPEYARLLGMREEAAPLLRELKERSTLPLVSKAKSLTSSEMFQLECRATDLRALQCNAPEDRRAGQELTQKFILVRSDADLP